MIKTPDLEISGNAMPKFTNNLMNLQQRLDLYRSIQSPHLNMTPNDLRQKSTTVGSKQSTTGMSGTLDHQSSLAKQRPINKSVILKNQ